MTTATAEKKSEEKKDPAQTADLPLKGKQSAGKLKDLNGRTIAEAPDPHVFEVAKGHAKNLDALHVALDKASESKRELVAAFKKSKKRRYCKITTDRQSYAFSTKTGEEKLVVEKIEGMK